MWFFLSAVLVVPVLISVAFLTLLERKMLSLVGVRVGPNKVSLFGFLQPLGDALKLSNKQLNSLSDFSFLFYYLSSFLMLFSSLLLWFTFCLEPCPVYLKFSVVFFMFLLSLSSLNSIVSGWSTFCKYSLIGSLRTTSQLLSYEACLYLCIFFFAFFMCSFSWDQFFFFSIESMWLSFPFLLYTWFPSFLAELNRTPYDFSEGESELVSGFNTEFGSGGFTLIFLSEYSNILFFSIVGGFIFFSGMGAIFSFLILFFVVWIRSVLPRFRFDKLMVLAWKFLIPSLTFFFLLSVSIL